MRKLPAEEQSKQPGKEYLMRPKPKFAGQKKDKKLQGKVAIITGGDSGIGRAVAVAYAKEGASCAISYLNENKDAKQTQSELKKEGVDCMLLPGDVGDEKVCKNIVKKSMERFGKIDILVNNAAEQHPTEDIEKISARQLERTFKTNIFSYFYLVKAVLPHLKKSATIINTTSVAAYRGSKHLLDYSSTKGAIVSFTRSLALNLADRGIRVNAVAPGPIWTPLIPASFPKDHVKKFGEDTPMKRPGEPEEVAPAYVFLASDTDSSYITGQVLHINGGEIING